MKQKVFVGLSGGVDSAVAAALLQRDGYDITAVFMKNWSGVTAGVMCPWEEDYASARQVAANLNIPLKLYDFEDQYRATVGQYLIETYRAGLTPNPDIMCNEEIKFKAFFERCLDEGADMIATGHYAKLQDGQLMRGKDLSKDQSYFLYRASPVALAKTLFPIGEYTNPEIRQLAAKFGLPNAKRPDSQGICFIGELPLKDFLMEFIPPKHGDIIDQTGRKVGQHDGAFFYTIGQRKGLNIGGGDIYYVYDKDIAKNIVYVTSDNGAQQLNRNQFVIADCVWYQTPQDNKDYLVLVRYRAPGTTGVLKAQTKESFEVALQTPERAITPGQSAVIYDSDIVIGGGIIAR